MESMQKFLLAFCLCFAVGAAQRNNKFLTWNTEGQKWSQVAAYLNHYDVLCIQESGALPTRELGPLQVVTVDDGKYKIVDEDKDGKLVITTSSTMVRVRPYVRHTVIPQFNGGVTVYKFFHNNVPYFMYYYNHLVDDAEARRINNDYRKFNMAIITREEASEIYIIPPHSRSENRIDVNRPTIGVDLSGYKVFTAHSDPSRNEIRQTIAKVARFMTSNNQCQHKRWIIMGDFNTENIPDPDPDFQGCFAEKVAPRQMTHPNKKRPGTGTIIDYAVFGGPNSFKGTLQANTRTGEGSSDHWPVEILPK